MANLRLSQIKQFHGNNEQSNVIPIVAFRNGVTWAIWPDCFVTQHGYETPRSLLMRVQIPLAAAWALTIHKAQGMTLDKFVADASKVFGPGQLYVLLSRTRTMAGEHEELGQVQEHWQIHAG
jgi:ATP-dependent DNA helicase PIF1